MEHGELVTIAHTLRITKMANGVPMPILTEAADALEAAQARIAALEAELAKVDRILRGSVPERWKDCTSAVGAVQSYIAELEIELAGAREAMLRAQLVFARYADLHACKGTPEGDAKAQANLYEANALARALKAAQP